MACIAHVHRVSKTFLYKFMPADSKLTQNIFKPLTLHIILLYFYAHVHVLGLPTLLQLGLLHIYTVNHRYL